jgi:hypothetical protein
MDLHNTITQRDFEIKQLNHKVLMVRREEIKVER